jgi:hypothetical protein
LHFLPLELCNNKFLLALSLWYFVSAILAN